MSDVEYLKALLKPYPDFPNKVRKPVVPTDMNILANLDVGNSVPGYFSNPPRPVSV